MNVIARKKLIEFWEKHPDAREALDGFFHVGKRSRWGKYADLKAVYGSADVVGKHTVINICGNKYRLILEIYYESALVLIRHVLTHTEYDAQRWRADVNRPTARKHPRK